MNGNTTPKGGGILFLKISRVGYLISRDNHICFTKPNSFKINIQTTNPKSILLRCVFETYFTLDAKADVKRRVLKLLIEVSRRVTPKQSLASLGATLVRKTAETGDEGAAFFLSLVPPTVRRKGAAPCVVAAE